MHEHRRRGLIEIARTFRKEPTESEAVLWKALRRKQLDGIKFRRQHPIGPFIVDFCAPLQALVVEVDGHVHHDQREADKARQELIEAHGYRFVRVSATMVEHELGGVLELIRREVSPCPALPRERERE